MIEIDNGVINPQVLMDRVRKNVLKIDNRELRRESNVVVASGANYALEQLNRIESDLSSALENIQIMNRTWLHQDAAISCKIKFLRPIVVFFKRAIRKTIYWFTQPYVAQQSDFNGAVTRAVSDSLRVQRVLVESLKK